MTPGVIGGRLITAFFVKLLQACAKNMLDRLWQDIYISVTLQGESIFGPSILESLIKQNRAKIVKFGLAEVTIIFENIRLDFSVRILCICAF